MMLLTVILLFALVMAGGATLAFLETRGRIPALPFSVLHGAVALCAIVLLLVHDYAAPANPLVNSATVLFILTATGGLLLLAFHAGRERLPALVVRLHAAFALVAFSLLVAGFVGG